MANDIRNSKYNSNEHVFDFKEINFGKVLSSLIEDDDITDIDIRPASVGEFSVWTVKRTSEGRKKLDLSKYTSEEKIELRDRIIHLPYELKMAMDLNYNSGAPILDAESEYKNKSLLRINAIHERITGSDHIPMLAIRKTPYALTLTKEKLISDNYCTEDFFTLMSALMRANCNVMICGLCGSGKTSLLRILCANIKNTESLVTIEDTREAYLERLYPDKCIGELKTVDKYGFEELEQPSLRQDITWLIISEIRGRAVIDIMDAVQSGHHLISTIHASGVKRIPYRMVSMAKADAETSRNLKEQIYNEINIGIYINYLQDETGAHRQIQEVCEYYVDEQGNQKCHMIYWYDFETKSFKTDKIQSEEIKVNLQRNNIDVRNIAGWVF